MFVSFGISLAIWQAIKVYKMNKRRNILRLVSAVFITVLIFQACLTEKYEAIEAETETNVANESDEQENVYVGFDFKTVSEYEIEISILNNLNLPLDGVYMELYTKNTLDEAGLLKTEAISSKVFKGITNKDGILLCKINPPIDISTLRTPPYNSFIVINRIRGKEVHLPYLPPIDLFNTTFFGTGDNDSNINTRDYYLFDAYLPWAINLFTSFSYPSENRRIINSHLKFDNWAKSKG